MCLLLVVLKEYLRIGSQSKPKCLVIVYLVSAKFQAFTCEELL